jgi:hypothetical protein
MWQPQRLKTLWASAACYRDSFTFALWEMFLFVLWPPPRSSGQSSWLQIRRSGFDSPRYQIFWEIVDLERGRLTLVSTIEELLRRTSSGSALENREYGRRDPSRWLRNTPLSANVGINYADKRRSPCRYSSFADSEVTELVFSPWTGLGRATNRFLNLVS